MGKWLLSFEKDSAHFKGCSVESILNRHPYCHRRDFSDIVLHPPSCLTLPTFSFLAPNKTIHLHSSLCIRLSCGGAQTTRDTEVSGLDVIGAGPPGWQVVGAGLSSSSSGSNPNESLSSSTFSYAHKLRNCNVYLLSICQTQSKF